MIAKGNLHAHGQKLAAYLITGKIGERAELVELRGFASPNIREAFIDVMIQAEATRCEKPFFHCYIRLPEGEGLEREQWRHVADRIEHQLGFDGQGRAVAFHHDRHSGETHMHMAWSRIDLDEMRAIDPGLFKNKLKEVSRQLENELGLARVRNERDPEDKTRAPARNEFEQARRLGTDLKAIRAAIRDCWERSDTGRGFEAALAEQGYILARGDRRDFVVIDPAGGDHALGKRITGANAGETRARLADIDKRQLPSVDQAKMVQAERARVAGPQLQTAPVKPQREGPGPAAAAAAAPDRSAAAAVEAPERSAAELAPPPEIIPSQPAAHGQGGIKEPGDVAGGLADSLVRSIGAVFEALADMFSPPAAPTPEQQKLDHEAAEERAEQLAARRARDEEDLRVRLEQRIRDDLAREQKERDEEYYRGRERER